ncbi:MAG: HD domain-containing protein [Acidobacteriota bacterium]|nr:HD domain-containing protein [Acidobacteriota bacterium]
MTSATNPAVENFAPASLAMIIPLFWEIGNLKRIHPANLTFSFAANLFLQSWKNVAGGADVRDVAIKITADTVAAAQLGAINADVLRRAELSETKIQTILERSFDLSSAPIEKNLRDELRAALMREFERSESDDAPPFAEKLARQPRSGATKPNSPRLIFDQPENHAEHVITVAVYAVLLAPFFNADIATVFLAALGHHFHNADLPDAGFAGEELLGEFLPIIFDKLREQCLGELPLGLHEPIKRTFVLIENAASPEARAFHAADVIDRVLQMRHHAEANEFNLKYALEKMELVHAGPVQAFHYQILRTANLV